MLALIYCIFALLCGWLEAILYDKRGAEAFKSNEHIGMTLQRVAAALAPVISVALYHFTGHFWILLELVPAALLFPAIHDEAYNFVRLWLKYSGGLLSDAGAFSKAKLEYKYGYQSPTTTAINDYNGKERTGLAIIGFTLLIALQVAYFLT